LVSLKKSPTLYFKKIELVPLQDEKIQATPTKQDFGNLILNWRFPPGFEVGGCPG